MRSFWLRKFISFLSTPKKRAMIRQRMHPPVTRQELTGTPLTMNLAVNVDLIKQVFGNTSDLVVREFALGTSPSLRAAIVYIENLIQKEEIQEHVLRALMNLPAIQGRGKALPILNITGYLKDRLLTAQKVTPVHDLQGIVEEVLFGSAILLVDTTSEALAISMRQTKARAIEEPDSESVIRGPREGFNEELDTTISLIRRKLQTPNLRVERLRLGTVTSTNVAIIYIEGIVNTSVLAEVRRRLAKVRTDGLLDSGYLEEFLEDSPFSPFPQINSTERPDRVAGHLLEGRVAVAIDGSPFVLTMPTLMLEFFVSPEDYYSRVQISILARGLRLLSFFISLLLPSLYVALTTFHQEMLPTPLALAIAAGRESVPVPAMLEALTMMFSFEILREAGIRMPRALGQAISIVGALIIGQAAVAAGLVSPLMIIVVALTAIASFTIPQPGMVTAIRLLSFPFVFLAGSFGLFGIIWGMLLLLIHLVQLRSFGVPYLAPYAPLIPADMKDSITRLHHWAMDTRPMSVATEDNLSRQAKWDLPWPNQQGSRPEKSPTGRRGGK